MLKQHCPACGTCRTSDVLTPLRTSHLKSYLTTDRTQVKRLHEERVRNDQPETIATDQRRTNGCCQPNTVLAHGQQGTFHDAVIENQSANEINSNTSSESGYIHPISQLDNTNANVCENIYNEPRFCGNASSERSASASYAEVLSCVYNISQYRTRQNIIESTLKAFRRKIYFLLILCLLLFLSNVIGGIYVFASKQNVYADDCFKCDLLPSLSKEDFAEFNVSRSEDGTCCIKSTPKALVLLAKALPNQKDVERNLELLNKLLARKRSAIQVKGNGLSENKIVWKMCDMKSGHLSYNSFNVRISVGGTYSLSSTVRFKKGSCGTRRKLGYHVRAIEQGKQIFTLASAEHFCLNGTNFEQYITTQTLFQVPLGQTWSVYIEISDSNKHLLLHHYHTLNVFEI